MTHAWMQNMYRDMARFRGDRESYVQTRRSLNRTAYKEDDAQRSALFEGDQVPFDCFFVCAACGYYVEKGTEPCPACGRNDWLDMGSERMAEDVRATEEAKRHAIPKVVSLLFLLLSSMTALVSLLIGRLSLMLEYLTRVGSCQTRPLLPPSSRCSITTSTPSPSQLLNAPRLSSSIDTTKQTVTAGS